MTHLAIAGGAYLLLLALPLANYSGSLSSPYVVRRKRVIHRN